MTKTKLVIVQCKGSGGLYSSPISCDLPSQGYGKAGRAENDVGLDREAIALFGRAGRADEMSACACRVVALREVWSACACLAIALATAGLRLIIIGDTHNCEYVIKYCPST